MTFDVGRLRELIAAAAPRPWRVHQPDSFRNMVSEVVRERDAALTRVATLETALRVTANLHGLRWAANPDRIEAAVKAARVLLDTPNGDNS